ncbi:MAG: hypothetical protein PHY34_05120 [Patescibacteria group bacterium]|nr:hypothetical protein [Patescibacteria group bacterium]MDD5715767.1 hypothetical protein [Patescibacteria group bacterium]
MMMQKLTAIKLLHTLVWLIIGPSIVYMVYSAAIGQINVFTWIGVALSIGEAIVILVNKWTCPLTPIAARYTEDRSPNFDIYLPRWLAKYNKHLFTPIMVAGWLLVLWRVVL